MTISEVLEEAWPSAARRLPWRVSGTTDYPVLLVNDETRALVARMAGGRKSERSRSWRGIALRPREVGQFIARLRGNRKLNARAQAIVGLLAETLQQARRTGVIIVQDGPDRLCRDTIVLHEAFHLFEHRNKLHRRSPAKLIKHAATSTAIPYLRKHGYDVGNAALVVSEVAAYAISWDCGFIGLRPEEAREWLTAYQEHCSLPLRRAFSRFRDSFP